MFKPELLCPAGNLERLKIACLYGADAVYIGGQRFGLRASADNFTDHEICLASEFIHANGKRLYVTLNAFLHDEDLEGLESYCSFLEYAGVDAVIVADPGVTRIVKACSSLEVHTSTQASCLNIEAAKLWKQLGSTRIVLAREVSIEEAERIGQSAGVEIELFVHGAMCMAYSGHCTISNFTAGRDSNRGGCIQSCRFNYTQVSNKNQKAIVSNFMSSKDLNGLRLLPLFFKHRIHSLKVEGRMKSPLYVATVTRVYREALDLFSDGKLTDSDILRLAIELEAFPHRHYTEASLVSPATEDSVYHHGQTGTSGSYNLLGIVVDVRQDNFGILLNMPLAVGEEIEILPFAGDPTPYRVESISDFLGDSILNSRQETVIYLPMNELSSVAKFNVIRIKNPKYQRQQDYVESIGATYSEASI